MTACPEERLDEVHRAATFIFDYLRNQGVPVRYFDQAQIPGVAGAISRAGSSAADAIGHFDVVAPDPDDSQFEPKSRAITCGAEAPPI